MASNVNRKRLHVGTKDNPGCGFKHQANKCPMVTT